MDIYNIHKIFSLSLYIQPAQVKENLNRSSSPFINQL